VKYRLKSDPKIECEMRIVCSTLREDVTIIGPPSIACTIPALLFMKTWEPVPDEEKPGMWTNQQIGDYIDEEVARYREEAASVARAKYEKVPDLPTPTTLIEDELDFLATNRVIRSSTFPGTFHRAAVEIRRLREAAEMNLRAAQHADARVKELERANSSVSHDQLNIVADLFSRMTDELRKATTASKESEISRTQPLRSN